MNGNNILEVRNLKTYFHTPHGVVKAVEGVSFDIKKGEVFGIVGESGSGKTLTALSILNLIPHPGRVASGEILFNGIDLLKSDGNFLRSIRGSKIAMVFQEPNASLDPIFTIGYQIMEMVLAHNPSMGKTEASGLAIEYLKKVHIQEPKNIFYSYPHQLSGGTKQRAMIASALINSPELLILDEPTTALDVTIQAQILDLLDEIIETVKPAVLFISHDFGIIAKMCGRVAVMYKGEIVEEGSIKDILCNPKDPYTVSLLESVKVLA